MKEPATHRPGPCLSAAALVALIGTLAFSASARTNQYDLRQPVPGGIMPSPKITSLVVRTQQATLRWEGWQGPYRVMANDGMSTNWTPVGNSTWDTTASFRSTNGTRMFKISGTPPNYSGYPNAAGDPSCIDCHEATASQYPGTVHANALHSLEQIGMDKNPACLPCHTVGYGLSSGFTVKSNTPHLAHVQCENCHGPAGEHALSPSSRFPVVTYQASLCGGCHTDSHHPTLDEWTESRHGEVTEHVQEYFVDPVNGEARKLACGPCHSGAVRLTMLSNYEKQNMPHLQKPMPSGGLAAHIGIECVVCHDPHMANPAPEYQPQLRNPKSSLMPFSYSTATTTSFNQQYNPNVSICGQCHNMRGAVWSETSRPPHHSTQYNILTGTAGVTNGVIANSAHRTIEGQCTACHMHAMAKAHPTDEDPNYTGHSFEPHMDACFTCHSTNSAPVLWAETQVNVSNKVYQVKALLEQWSLTKAPTNLTAKYKNLVWEYNTAGGLSSPDGTLRGPTAAEQNAATNGVPNAIKEARFNLYLVYHDASWGIHNTKYTMGLLQVAEDKVKALLE